MHQSKPITASRFSRFARRILALSLTGLVLSGCARFRIEELEPRVLFSAPVVRAEASNPGEAIHLQESGRVPFNLPVRPAVNASSAYIADPARNLVRVFNSGTTDVPESLLTGPGAQAGEETPRIAVKLGVPGWIAVDEDDETLYVQSFERDTSPVNRSEQPIENRPSNQTSIIRQMASTVLVLDVEDSFRTVGNLGVDGFDTAPFPEILRLIAEEDGVLHVLYRGAAPAKQRGVTAPAPLILASYRRGELLSRYAEFEAGVATAEELRQYLVEWENIVPGPGGAFAIYSVALRQKSSYDLISRRIFHRSGPEAAPVELLRIDDPADYFISSRPDGGFYLMNAEEDGSRILYKTFSPQGEYLNNRLIIFPGLRASWRESFLGLDGRIFSSRLYLGKFELYEWN
ncbi:MAG: hypothetical protein NXI24_13905 [bacterium]|nr:hypothetical protein [bacterium]